MAKLNINIENHEQNYTVSEMRRRLAQVLSKLNGDQKVTFSFRAELAEYQPAPTALRTIWDLEKCRVITVVPGELARPENN